MNRLPINHPLLQFARQFADLVFSPLGAILAALATIFLLGCAYTVDQTEQVVITQFGRPVGEPINAATPGAGLHLKLPFIQTANRFEKRILEWDGPPNEMTTRDKLYVVVDTFARWRIADPLKYFESLRDERSALSRLDDIIGSETRNVIARHDLIEVVRSDKSRQPEQDVTLKSAVGESDVALAVGGRRHEIEDRGVVSPARRQRRAGIEIHEVPGQAEGVEVGEAVRATHDPEDVAAGLEGSPQPFADVTTADDDDALCRRGCPAQGATPAALSLASASGA